MKLQGVRVLDLSQFMPGPYLAMVLADHGAEVIKVEKPGEGDPARHIGPIDEGESAFFRNLNRGKSSIALNLKDADDRAVLLKLIEKADVVVESFRPGVVDRLGIGYGDASAINPRIVYCSISAFGQDGPYAGRPAHDLAVEGLGGLLSMQDGGTDRLELPALAFSDIASALNGVAAVAMALFARERTGRGDHIDISLHESLIGSTLNICSPVLLGDRMATATPAPQRENSPFYNAYHTADRRRIVLAGQGTGAVAALLEALDRPDLIAVARGRGEQAPVFAVLDETFARLTLEEAGALLTRLDISWSPMNSLAEAFDDPHLAARGFIVEDERGRRHLGTPIRFREAPAQLDLRVPGLDEHATWIRKLAED